MTVELDAVPPLTWTHGPSTVEVRDQTLVLTSAPRVDWTRDARGGDQQLDASALAFEVRTDAVLSARVAVLGMRTTFDAGALVVWADESHWAKLCFEMSPAGEAMVVSVVTNEYSDDANSSVVNSRWVYLRVARIGEAVAFQWSRDGEAWRFVRLFRLATSSSLHMGFLAQSPNGDACTAEFSQIDFEQRTLDALREGEVLS